MDLRPIYPARAANGQTLTLFCSNCRGHADSGTAFADLDAKPGTYLCVSCTGFHLTASQRHDALVERDRLELALKGA